MASVLNDGDLTDTSVGKTKGEVKRWRAVHLFFIVAVTFVFYARTFDNYWIKDDLAIGNFFVGGEISWDSWLRELWPSYMTAEHYWRPVPLFPGFVEYQFWGLNPAGYHIDNTLMHALSACMLYFLANRLTSHKSILIGFVAALVFAINPINAEAVVWIMQRMVLCSFLFSLAGLHCWLNAVEGRGKYWRILGLGCLILSLLSKEIALTLPGLFFFLDLCYGPDGDKGRLKRAAFWAIPCAVILAAYFLCRHLMWGQLVNTYAGLEPFEYAKVNRVFENFLATIGFGLAPVNRGIFGATWTNVLRSVLLGIYCIGGLRALFLVRFSPEWRRLAGLSFGLFAFGLLPIIPICWVDERLFNARFFYQPACGFQLLIVASLLLPIQVGRKWERTLGRGAAFVLLAVMGVSLGGGLTAFDHGSQQVRGLQQSILAYSDRLEEAGEKGKTIVALYTPTQYEGVPTLEYSLKLAMLPPLSPRAVKCIPLVSRDYGEPGKWAAQLNEELKKRKIEIDQLRWLECRANPLGIRPYFGATEPALGQSPAELITPPDHSFLGNDGPEPSFTFKAHKDAHHFHIRFAVRKIDYAWGPNLVPGTNCERSANGVVTFKPSFRDPSQPDLPDLWAKMMQQRLEHPFPLTWRVVSFDKSNQVIGVSKDFHLVVLNAL
ncbi:MAG: hypothetical protein ACI97A_002919 [Planctomycetota bacterium]|jgi:hypothetical protein